MHHTNVRSIYQYSKTKIEQSSSDQRFCLPVGNNIRWIDAVYFNGILWKNTPLTLIFIIAEWMNYKSIKIRCLDVLISGEQMQYFNGKLSKNTPHLHINIHTLQCSWLLADEFEQASNDKEDTEEIQTICLDVTSYENFLQWKDAPFADKK